MRGAPAALLVSVMDFERKVSAAFVAKLHGLVAGTGLGAQLAHDGLTEDAKVSGAPIDSFTRWLSAYSAEQHPEVPAAEALRRVGFDMAHRSRKYEGASLAQTMSLLPERMQSLGTFDVTTNALTPFRYVAHFEDVGLLHTFFLGVLQGATSSTGTFAEVRWSPEGLSGARYEVRAEVVPSEHLAGVQQPVRVEDALELAHQVDLRN